MQGVKYIYSCKKHVAAPFFSRTLGNTSPGEYYARIAQFDLFVHRLGSSWSCSIRAALEPCLALDSFACLKAVLWNVRVRSQPFLLSF